MSASCGWIIAVHGKLIENIGDSTIVDCKYKV